MQKNQVSNCVDYPAIVPECLIRQAAAFTAPRGRLEMGGLLIGHVDEEGNNVAVTGLFPEQLKETSGYCEFDGMWAALAAAACDAGNQIGDDSTPLIRVIGWIHTHPDIGIFLSGTDIKTFRSLRDATPERRIMAVVVDPLREQNGVFLTEREPNESRPADGELVLSSELQDRYMKMLDQLEKIRSSRGLKALPCILPGPLRAQRNLQGVRDDSAIELERGFFREKRIIRALENEISLIQKQVSEVINQRDIINEIQLKHEELQDKISTIQAQHVALQTKCSQTLIGRFVKFLRRK